MVIKFQFDELNGRLMWCDFGANLVQHFMRRYSRYQTVLLKLKEIICALRQLFQYTKSSAHAGLFVLYGGGSVCKEPRRPIYILDVLWYNYLG